MQVVHVVPHIDVEASGPSYSVPMLCAGLRSSCESVALYCQRRGREVPDVEVQVFREWRSSGRFAVSIPLALALRKAAKKVDIIHNHGFWAMCNVAAGWSVTKTGCLLVHSPRGTLSSWALSHSRLKKRILWPTQKQTLHASHLVHATSAGELREVRATGYSGPIAVLPNGIGIPTQGASFTTERKRLLFLSRLHEKKGIELLLEAWGRLQGAHHDWDLWIVGVGEPRYEAHLRNSASRFGAQRTYFQGGLYGPEKERAYRSSDLFVLPTYSENFGMVVAEALSYGVPCIVTQGAPWNGLVRKGCGWWTEVSVEGVHGALSAALATPRDQLQVMGEQGRQWMKDEFSWDVIGRQMGETYAWLLDNSRSVPPWVSI